MFSPCSYTAKCIAVQLGIKQTQHFLTLWCYCQQCLVCHMLLVREGRNGVFSWRWTEAWRNPYSRMKGICLWSHIALAKEINISIHSFSPPVTAYELILGPNKPALTRHTNIIMRMKPEQCLRIYSDMYSQLQILQHRVSTHNRSYLKRINLQNET
jgi:hypothetical protein